MICSWFVGQFFDIYRKIRQRDQVTPPAVMSCTLLTNKAHHLVSQKKKDTLCGY